MKVNGMFAMFARMGRRFPMTENLTDPERELALSYATAALRPHLRTLWRLDERFGAIVAGTTEATIGEMRLLWWREAIATSDEGAKAEPLLEEIAGAIRGTGSDASEWGAMAEGWHALLEEPVAEAELDRFAEERGGRLFRLSAALLGAELRDGDEVDKAGRGWSLVDLSFRHSDAGLALEARAKGNAILRDIAIGAWPSLLRPLGALTLLAQRDARNPDPVRRQGAPRRIARLLAYRLFGR
jgi:phytoene synthase